MCLCVDFSAWMLWLTYVLRCFFPAPTLYSFRSIVWGSPFFSPLPFLMFMLQFFPQPCLPVLSTPLLDVCIYVWTGVLPFSLVYYATGYVAGTCVLVYLCCNNKGLLLLLLYSKVCFSDLRHSEWVGYR